MLGKRFKFEMKSRSIYLAVVSAAVLILSVIFSIVNNSEMSSETGELVTGTVIAFSYMAICGAAFFLPIQTVNRFNKTFLGNEGYLINTFPVKGSTHILADFFADIIQVIITVVLLIAFHLMDSLFNENARSQFMHNYDFTMEDYYHSGSSTMDVACLAVIYFITVIVLLLFIIWIIKLGINISKNLISSENRAVPTIISTLIVLVGIVISILIIYFSQKQKYETLLSGLVREGAVSLTEIGFGAVLIVLISHIVMLIAVLLANMHIINKRLNL